MSIEGKIYVVIAGNKRFKPYVDYAVKSSAIAGYTTKVYDLGDLGYGMPFTGKVGNERNAKIPCKPEIIQHAMKTIAPGDWIAWCDADAVIKKRFDEIKGMYDIGVTMRQPKASPHDMPINAGIVFCCKTPKMNQNERFSNSMSFLGHFFRNAPRSLTSQLKETVICLNPKLTLNF